MDRHQRALQKLVQELSKFDPICSVIAIGSVGRGDYRPESDMDVNVVSWRYQEIPRKLSWEYSQQMVDWDGVRLDEGYVDGIKTHLNCSTPQNYQCLIMSAPVWRWGRSRILYDPSGIADWGERCIEQFFEDNPQIAEACRRFHDEYLHHKRDRRLPRAISDTGGVRS